MEFSEEDIKRFWSKVDKKGDDECWNWTAGTKGRHNFEGGNFWLNGKGEQAHRCSLFLEKGEAPINKPLALHKCKQNRLCCNPNHLYYGDNQDNSNDSIKDNTIARGETNGNSKLTEFHVKEIRQKYIPWKYSSRKLAKEYNVNFTTICSIINNEIWKDIH